MIYYSVFWELEMLYSVIVPHELASYNLNLSLCWIHSPFDNVTDVQLEIFK